jgi:hypothetical protein
VGSGDQAEEWEDEYMRVEMVDSQQALIMIGKYHKLFSDRTVVQDGLKIEGLQEMLDKVYGKSKDIES